MVDRISRVTVIVVILGMLLAAPAAQGQDAHRYLLYATQDNYPVYHVYVLDVTDGEVTELGTVHDRGGDAGWSPGGRYVYLLDTAESMDEGRTLTLVEADSGRRFDLPEPVFGSQCSLPFWWSPDDHWLAYAIKTKTGEALMLLDPATGESVKLSDDALSYEWLAWSPNSRYLIYAPGASQGGLQLIVWDVSAHQTIKSFEAGYSYNFPTWSPTSDYLSYNGFDTVDVVIDSINADVEQHYSPGEIGDWSPDGRYLTVFRLDYTSPKATESLPANVMTLIDVEAGAEVSPSGILGIPSVDRYDAAWSADGRYLAASVYEDAVSRALDAYVYDVAEDRTIRVTDTPRYFPALIWSPVGHKLAFVSSPTAVEGGGHWEALTVYDVDSGQRRDFSLTIAPVYYVFVLNWSPNGESLIVWTDPGLSIYDTGSGDLSRIDPAFTFPNAVRWSPDGGAVALPARNGDAETDIFVYYPADHTLTNVTDTPDSYDSFLGWRGAAERDSLIFCGEG